MAMTASPIYLLIIPFRLMMASPISLKYSLSIEDNSVGDMLSEILENPARSEKRTVAWTCRPPSSKAAGSSRIPCMTSLDT